MLTQHIMMCLSDKHMIALSILIAAMQLSQEISAQESSFVGDTVVPPHLLDLREHGVLHDFGLDEYGLAGLIGRYDGQGVNYDYVVRYHESSTRVDTLYQNISPPSPSNFYHFDIEGRAIALGFGFDFVEQRFLVATDDAGESWDTIDIGDEAYYQDLIVVNSSVWLLETLSPLAGWRYLTPDTVYWVFHQERTKSWAQPFGNDSLLLFVRGTNCLGTYDSDTGYFQFARIGDVVDDLIPIEVPSSLSPPVPPQMGCPLLRFVGFDGTRIWFTRRWHIDNIDSALVQPTAVYSYDLLTGIVQNEYFFPRPRSEPRAVLFADHLFFSLDSQLVYRHINETPSTPFIPVAGVKVGLGNLQVHDGALYGSRSSGLIMRIRQVSSVPTSEVDETAAFTAEIQGSEIAVFAVHGATPRDIPLELFDVQGRRLSTSSIASGSSSGRLPAPSVPGVYFLRCGGSESSTTLRVFVP